MSTYKVKANWEDSSDEEDDTVRCAVASEAVASEVVSSEAACASEAVASPSIDTTTINRCDCFACISDSYEIEKYISETGFPPQCEKKIAEAKQYHDDEDEGYAEDDEGYAEDDDGYEEDEYDDACDMVDKKMGNYVRCR